MCQVIKRDGEVIAFDVCKICKAIQKAFESVEREIEESVEIITNALECFAHALAHWFLHAFHSVTRRAKAVLRYNLFFAHCMETVIRVKIKLLMVSYLENAHTHQKHVRTQDRGTKEDSNSDISTVTFSFKYALPVQ